MKKIYLAIGCALTVFTFSSNAQTTTTTFNYTGAMQTFVVPSCVNSIDVDISGAQGGGDASVSAPGGNGGRVQATMSVTPGQTLNIFVGGQGDLTGTPGYNGGGSGIGGSPTVPGGGGGGASDIRINGTTFNDRVIVAGGGGGGTENGGSSIGGDGGGLVGGTGGNGPNPWGCTNLTAATGGTQSAGGLGGTSTSCAWNGSNGTFGVGGNTYMVYRSAGGGGGWYGGGGAHNGCSGGGGSSYTNGLFTAVIHTPGYRLGDGIVTLTYSTASAPPATPGTITGSAALCFGTTSTYSIATVPGASSYTWSVTGGSTINSGQGTTSITLTAGNFSGNISVIANNACGSSSASTFALTINQLPNVTAIAASSPICSGSSDVLTASGASTYVWSSGGTASTETVSPTSTTTYTVTGTDANGCVSTAPVSVTVNPLPTVTATAASNPICNGSSDVLTAAGASTYVWSSGGTASTETVSPTSMTTYTVTGTDANGCANTATVMVMVNPLPTVTATAASNSICIGSSDVLTAAGASTYVWSSGGNASTETVSPTSMTTYTVTGTDANGCVNTATVSVNVNPLPTVTATAISNSICTGSSDALNAAGASTYVWSSGGTASTEIVSPTSPTTYTVTGTDANGCVNTATVFVNVNALPIVDLGNDITQCGGTVTLDAGNPGSTYLWNTNATTQTISVSSSGTYYVDVTNGNGCTGSDTVMITINPLPTVTGSATSTTVCVNDASVTLTGTPVGGTWSGPGVTGSSFSPMTAGTGAQTVTYSFTDVNGCTNTATVVITVNGCVGVAGLTLANNLVIFPNPNSGSFTVAIGANAGDVKMDIVDLQGRVIFSSVENDVHAGFSKQISMDDVANGIYMLRITTNSETVIQKISVQK
jgi:hypothetical protein